MPTRVAALLNVPHLRRVAFHARRIGSQVDLAPASRLLARSALHPGLSELGTDMVSGGEGSELYRIAIPEAMCAESLGTLAPLRLQHE
jgi:hypothetical protein